MISSKLNITVENLIHNSVEKFQNSSGYILGFNTTIDAIRNIDQELIDKIDINIKDRFVHLKTKKSERIRNINDFYLALYESLKINNLNQTMIYSKNLFNFFKEHISWNSISIGGTPSNCISFLKILGVKKIILYCNNIDKNVVTLLPQGIIYFLENEGVFTSNPKSDIDTFKSIHWIFEYKSESCFEFRKLSKNVRCKEDNRMVIGYNLAKMTIHEEFFNKIVNYLKDYPNFFLSGFHILSKRKGYISAINSLKKYLIKIRKCSQDSMIHYEIANFFDTDCLKYFIKSIFPLITSLGFEEKELKQILKVRGITLPSDDDVQLMLEHILKMQQKYNISRIHFHTREMSFCSIDSEKRDVYVEYRGLLLSSIGSTNYAKYGYLPGVATWAKELNVPFSEIGLKFFKSALNKFDIPITLKSGKWIILVVPNRIIKNPKILCGLGDVTSLTAFVYSCLKRTY